MVEKIASDIWGILKSLAPSPDLDRLIGMGDHIKSIQLLLRLDLKDEARMIGIWGPPGIGKSTIAQSLFKKLSSSFPLSAIMVDIRGSYPRPCLDKGNAQRKLQKEMLSQMIKHKDIVVTHLGVAQERLKHRKVLLVLDDVDRLAQLEALAGHTQWFGPGSRIIIITEDISVLNAHGMINDIYRVPYPSTDEALQMFCVYAFGQKFPEDGFRGLAYEVAQLAGNLPLGLEVMGSHFKGLKSKQKWLMELPRVTDSLDQTIESDLRFSYDALSREDKDLFIHIACFFNNETIEKVVGHLVKSFPNVRRGLDVLAEKSLISTDWGMIKMHSLLAQLGKEIVREQCDRRFLNDNEDIRKVLINPTTMAKNVIGINSTYNMTWGKVSEKACEEMSMTWPKASEKAFEEMSSLKFLRLRGLHITPLKYISPKLQLLDWGYSWITSFPSNINVENLVEIKMVDSELEKLWEGIKQLQNLKWIDLSSSRNLKELPDLSNATHLQELNLSGCSSLTKLHFSIGGATNLQKLDLSGCSSMVTLPSSIRHAANLRELNLFGCLSLVKLPSFGKANSLQKLDLRHCSSLVELPSSIGNATNLQELDLSCCSSLVTLPTSIGNLQRLTGLNLSECSKLEVLPTNINLESLTELNLTDCSLLKSFPEISTNIKFLYLVGTAIKEVPSTIRSWSRLKEFEISFHENLKDSPHAFDSITELHLTDTGIQEIGPWIKGCSRLVRLKVSGCTKLVSLPQLPDSISELDAKNCVFLERLDCSFRNPKICLKFLNCFKLDQEATDLIIQTSTRNVSVLPGGEVPACFTYRASGGFVTLELNEKPLCRSTKFKACILLVKRGDDEDDDCRALKINRI